MRANLSWGVASKCHVSRTDVKKISDMNPRFEVFMTPLLVLITAIKLHGDDLINLHDKECEIKLQKYCNTD